MAYYHSKYNVGSRKKKSKASRIIYWILFILILVGLYFGFQLYRTIFKPNTWAQDGASISITVPTGSGFTDLKAILYGHGIIVNRKSFEWLAEKKNLETHIHPGKYTIDSGISNNDLINLLRSGNQTPVKLIINNIRTREELAQSIGHQLELDSLSLIKILEDSATAARYGKTVENILTLFIPNTYEFFWNTTADAFMQRMYAEYEKFWNKNRMAKAKALGYTPGEISILASIVEKETTKNDEKPAIAGVYLNRLKYNWRLQADPTVVYAWGDFSIRRVLNLHKRIDSPYNTYVYYGLPPGPICIPSIASIDAVLNRQDHNYMFFCAKDDFSGYHVFAVNSAQHIVNANKYRKALDKRNIRK